MTLFWKTKERKRVSWNTNTPLQQSQQQIRCIHSIHRCYMKIRWNVMEQLKSITVSSKSSNQIVYALKFNVIEMLCTHIYWTVPGFGQSIEPAIDYQMMDLLYHECLVHPHRYYCIHVRVAIQQNVAVSYDYHCRTPIGHSIDRLFPNGLTCCSELIPSQYNIENGGFHSRTRIIWFIQSLCQFVRFDILLQSSAKEIKVDIFIRFYWKYSDITYFILLRANTKKAITFQSVENAGSLQKGKAFYTSFN